MRTSFAIKGLTLVCVAAAALAFAPISQAQMPGTEGQMNSSVPNQTAIGTTGGGLTDQLQFGTMGHQVEREQDAAYRAFLKEPEPARKIELGKKFLRQYPKSPFEEQIDVGMMNAYREEQQWKDAYRFGDSALALSPDDVDVLTIIGWTIPHVSGPDDPDAQQQLNKAETYAKHAIIVMAKMSKPHDATEAQFAEAKAKRTYQAHSALGLVYFRRNDYENSTKELQQATSGNPTPDATDLFVLGADLHHLNRFSDSADAFRACSQITGTLQDQCKKNADAVAAEASQSQAR